MVSPQVAGSLVEAHRESKDNAPENYKLRHQDSVFQVVYAMTLCNLDF